VCYRLDLVQSSHASEGKDPDYLRITEQRMRKLFTECDWRTLRDITAESFRRWRAKQDLAAKTLNHYLITIRTLLNWLEKQGKLHGNPLKTVETTRKAGGSERKRRAFTDEEISLLLKAAPTDAYRLIIRTAVLTGLRYGEIAALLWGDLRLDDARPCVMLRDEIVKNRNGKPHSLHPDLAAALAAFRPADAVAHDAVFPSMPDMDDHRALLAKAGVLYVSGDRYADFHSFRGTFATNLQRAGVPQRAAMELMRHSDRKLTDFVYTDVNLLHTAEAVSLLKSYGEPITPSSTQNEEESTPKKSTKKCDKALVKKGRELSANVPICRLEKISEVTEREDVSLPMSSSVSMSQEKGNGSGGRARASATLLSCF